MMTGWLKSALLTASMGVWLLSCVREDMQAAAVGGRGAARMGAAAAADGAAASRVGSGPMDDASAGQRADVQTDQNAPQNAQNPAADGGARALSPTTNDAGPLTGFVHPGLLITREDLTRMQAHIAAKTEPHYASYIALIDDPESHADKVFDEPPEIIGRNSASRYASTRYAAESAAATAFQNALVYALSHEVAHADKTVEILNAYAHTTKHFDKSDPERDLEAAILGWLWVSAAELVRHSGYTGWSASDLHHFDMWIRNVVYTDTDYEPSGVLVHPKTNGAGARGTFSLRTKLAIGVYLDDRSIYDAAIDDFFHGQGNGAPSFYIDPMTGQTWEAGRDQGHAQGGLSRLIETAHMASNQGDPSLYAWQSFALKRAIEYIASYNLGNAVPYVPMQPYTTDWADVYPMISNQGRGQFATIYELPYAYFHSTLALDMPHTRQVLDKVGSEIFSKNYDDPMFATLTYRR